MSSVFDVLTADGFEQVAYCHDASTGLRAIVAIHSTVSPDLPASLAAQAAPKGVRVVDAPVSGGAMGAHDGTLAV